ncbi:hypothetical protein JOF28_000396 [Leucobacter exalbidus]|uniref:Uncharacterized protein n=1 Tax=Leucobacter exalbidus TaxID=662960 RepID=A0A940PTU2_9MICO|nr:hypothetical protein [Leucobacter exalbidus]MBP1325164.1 hypothetical protein [Leucobacter exalbidus]
MQISYPEAVEILREYLADRGQTLQLRGHALEDEEHYLVPHFAGVVMGDIEISPVGNSTYFVDKVSGEVTSHLYHYEMAKFDAMTKVKTKLK